ncbi:hypothetical protein A2U01_0087827, partial [Trifolium medium]|nr:hypothetical protein [Trifolium medium]
MPREEDGDLQGDLRMPNEFFRIIHSSRNLRSHEMICSPNSVAFIRVRLPLPPIGRLDLQGDVK